MNIRIAALTASLALFACNGGDTDDTDDTAGTPPPACETVSDQFPGDESSAVYYRTSFTWSFTAVDTSAAVTLTDAAGTAVPGSGDFVGSTFVWNPNDELLPSTDYNLSLSFCDGVNMADTSFTTSAIGASTDEATLVGRTFLMDLGDPDVNFIEPPGVGSILQSQIGNVQVLVGVASVGTPPNTIDMIGALGDEGTPPTQDLCVESIPFPAGADFIDNPFFEIGPENTIFNVAGIAVNIDDLVISGAFDTNQTVIAGAVLEGKVDTRPLVPLFVEGGEPDAVCALVVDFGINCEDCSDGQPFCLSLKVNNINAERVEGLELVERTPAHILADTTNCPPTPPPVP